VIFVVGDIHGHLEKLARVLAEVESRRRPGDLLVFIGDFIDRGPDSPGVLSTLIQIGEETPDAVFLRGNHEQMMLDARRRFDPAYQSDEPPPTFDAATLWFANGGDQTLASYDVADDELRRWWEIVPDEHWRFIESTSLEHVTERFHFVHAGLLPPGETWDGEELSLDPRLWIREPFLGSEADFGGRIVVFGHTPMPLGRPYVRPNMIGIDTGAAYGGPLTAIALSEDPERDPVLEILQAT
jgi:serine/threonine protein phosphatase 1